MKKSIFSLVTAGLLVGALSTSAMAREEVTVGVLTKATTKLIKENRDLSQNVLQTQASQEALTNKVDEQKIFIKNVADENSKTNERINLAEQNNRKTESLSKDNQSKINDLYKFRESASKDLDILNNNLKELSKKVGFTENTLSKVTATNAQKEVTPVIDKKTETNVERLQQSVLSLENENRALKNSISSFKSSTENELRSLKAKLDKAPEKVKESSCKSCQASSDDSSDNSEANDIIKNFIKQ